MAPCPHVFAECTACTGHCSNTINIPPEPDFNPKAWRAALVAMSILAGVVVFAAAAHFPEVIGRVNAAQQESFQ